MGGITDLGTLLASLRPILEDGEFVFVSRPRGKYGDGAELNPIATIAENEGLTLVVQKDRADAAGERYHGVFRMITLQVHSSLETVGLSATVANVLSKRGISVNVIAAYYHDHLFVPSLRAQDAIDGLAELTSPRDAQT